MDDRVGPGLGCSGLGGGCLKIAPPLSIPEDALVESLNVFEEAFDGVAADA